MATVSVRIEDDLEEEIEALGIDVGEVVRETLKREVERRRREEIKRRGEELEGILSDKGVTSQDIVTTIREDRDSGRDA